MRRLLLTTALLRGCAQQSAPTVAPAPVGPEMHAVIVDHALSAFSGRLLGTDHGEFAGSLMFEDAGGDRITLLKENVHGIVRNDAGVFVFTGLGHLGINDGYIYTISGGEPFQAKILGRLPGAPQQVVQRADGVTSFLVFTGRHSKNGRPVYACYALAGSRVAHDQACSPPRWNQL
jgi:hypothetical protein